MTKVQEEKIVDETMRYIQIGRELYKKKFSDIEVCFDLTGHTIGMYKRQFQRKTIRYNAAVFAKYFDENFLETIPHEVAHYLVDMRFSRKRIRPHGEQWRKVMSDFGVDAKLTANYDLSDIPKRQYSMIPYACGCQQHSLGIRRHNKLQKGLAEYACRQCGDVIKPV